MYELIPVISLAVITEVICESAAYHAKAPVKDATVKLIVIVSAT